MVNWEGFLKISRRISVALRRNPTEIDLLSKSESIESKIEGEFLVKFLFPSLVRQDWYFTATEFLVEAKHADKVMHFLLNSLL